MGKVTDVGVYENGLCATMGGGAQAGAFLHVYVTTQRGSSVASPHDVFDYEGLPTDLDSATSGPVSGCQQIVINGTGFLEVSAVGIGQGHGPGATAVPSSMSTR